LTALLVPKDKLCHVCKKEKSCQILSDLTVHLRSHCKQHAGTASIHIFQNTTTEYLESFSSFFSPHFLAFEFDALPFKFLLFPGQLPLRSATHRHIRQQSHVDCSLALTLLLKDSDMTVFFQQDFSRDTLHDVVRHDLRLSAVNTCAFNLAALDCCVFCATAAVQRLLVMTFVLDMGPSTKIFVSMKSLQA